MRPIARSWVSFVIAVILGQGCAGGGGGGVFTGYECNANRSPGFSDQVPSEGFSIPVALMRCPWVLYDVDTLHITSSVAVDMMPVENNNVLPDYGYMEMWTKNTATSSGQGIVDYIADEDFLLYSGVSPTSYGSTAYRYYAPVQYIVGWPAIAELHERDSLFVVYPTNVTYAASFVSAQEAGAFFVGTVRRGDSLPGNIIGASSVQAGGSSTWSLLATWDTTAYFYKWYLNGMLQPSDTAVAFSRSFTAAATYTLRVEKTLLDTVVSVTKVVTVPVTVFNYGPTELNPNQQGDWWSSASAGTPPYSYYWEVDGIPAGTDSTISMSFGSPMSNHSIAVYVTDANGRTGFQSRSVYIKTGSCEPEDPNCQEQLRVAPAHGASRPSTIQTKRPPLAVRRP